MTDRLKEIKDRWNKGGFLTVLTRDVQPDITWLINEIERLRWENDQLQKELANERQIIAGLD
jgi:hypothetical protein